jgi:HSP20 family protein
MTQLTKRRNGNGGLFPALANDFLTEQFLTPRLLGFEGDFFNEGMTIPPVNVSETSKEFKMDLSVPGMKRDDFKVNIENGALTISSEKEEEKKEDDKNYKRREYSYNKFSRTFQLPENVDENNINAKYDNGILQVTIPKKEVTQTKPKKEIKVG